MNAEQIASREKKLRELQDQLGYVFHDRGLLEHALCHSSYSNENGLGDSNERLEFLGDAVLELTVSHLLFDFYTEYDEGLLTKERSKLVCKNSLVKIAKSLKLEKLVLCGKSMRQSPIPDSVCSDAFEAILGALYLDGGYEEAFRVVKRQLAFRAESVKLRISQNTDPKSLLQAFTQEKKSKMPQYKTISIDGPDHAPLFKVKVIAFDREWLGDGASRKAAEFSAAEKALHELSSPQEERNDTKQSFLSRLLGIWKRG